MVRARCVAKPSRPIRLSKRRGAFVSQKRKLAAEKEEEEGWHGKPSKDWPVWVVCNNSYALWKAGMPSLPGDLKFSPATVGQVAAVKYWAAQQVESFEASRAESGLEGPEWNPPQPPPPPVITMEAVRPHSAGVEAPRLEERQHPSWATPATIALVERLKAASPSSVVSPV